MIVVWSSQHLHSSATGKHRGIDRFRGVRDWAMSARNCPRMTRHSFLCPAWFNLWSKVTFFPPFPWHSFGVIAYRIPILSRNGSHRLGPWRTFLACFCFFFYINPYSCYGNGVGQDNFGRGGDIHLTHSKGHNLTFQNLHWRRCALWSPVSI